MNKKSKHKKAKPIIKCETPVLSENIENFETMKAEDLMHDEKEKCCELVVLVSDENVCQQDTPVKPKRKKGKKKNHDQPVIDTTAVSEPHEIVSNLNISNEYEKQSSAHSDIHTNNEVASSGKKTKEKKEDDKIATSSIEVTKYTVSAVSDETVSDNICLDLPDLTPKKKHKKKKQNDSTKMESCISAFQKLLQPNDSHEESHISDSSFTEDIQNNTDNKQLLDTVVKSKKKKKNKKDKKSAIVLATPETSNDIEEDALKNTKDVNSQIVILTEENKTETLEKKLSIDNKETSPKPKAKIAKPVDKKRKEIILQNIPKVHDEEQLTVEESKNAINLPINSSYESSKPTTDLESNIEITCSIFDDTFQMKEEQNIGLDESLDEKKQSHEKISNNDFKFTEVRPSRKKKRAEKNTNIEISKEKDTNANENLKCSVSKKHEEINITPDFIHHPRSSSQQQFDNNNTIIRELNSSNDVQTGIIISMSVPVIEGSGESPEVRSKLDPLDVKVTEIKTDMIIACVDKSMTPEKKDEKVMEDLKKSIEKSLAELTELEKSEIEAEKKFVEVLEYNLKNSITMPHETKLDYQNQKTDEEIGNNMVEEKFLESCSSPVCPVRKNKKGKSKKKDKHLPAPSTVSSSNINPSGSETNQTSKETNKNQHKDKDKHANNSNTGKQQCTHASTSEQSPPDFKLLTSQETNTEKKETKDKDINKNNTEKQQSSHECILEQSQLDSKLLEAVYEPIESFEDALTSSTEDVNLTFEMIAKEATALPEQNSFQKPEISITEPDEDKNKNKKESPISQPKNLLGHPKIPVQSNSSDYKKEKNKAPNARSAKVKIKDADEVKKTRPKDLDKNKALKENIFNELITFKTNENDDFVYKYSFRKVFLPNVCHVCMKEFGARVACNFCSLLFYCCQKHKEEDWVQHQFLCFVLCTMAHLKEQKFIYGDVKHVSGQEYRIMRMKIIISCEKLLKRKLAPWEQEALLYPRICSDGACREWRQGLLTDCKGCGQVSYCTEHPEHLPESHKRWCKSYTLYQKLVCYQQKFGRLEPKLPTKVMSEDYQFPETMRDVLTLLFDEKIEMSDIEYAAVTQLASAPLTAAYSCQAYSKLSRDGNGFTRKATFTIHIVGAELQFEADALNKWETFFLHLRPDIKHLQVVLISQDLNPCNLPLGLLSRVKLCEKCRASGRRLFFSFIDKKTYQDYFKSEDYLYPNLVCAFNQSIERASGKGNGKDHWPPTLGCVAKLRTPLLITAYTPSELSQDLSRVKRLCKIDEITKPQRNNFASERPDRNFITDDEMPLLFKNYCYAVLCG